MNGIIQNGYMKLTKRLFPLALKRILAICAAVFVLTMLLITASVGEYNFARTYEALMVRAGIRYLFLAAIAFWMLSEAAAIHSENFRSGGVYTLMMLPTPRRSVFLACCTRGVVCVLLLWTVQAAALFAAYAPSVAICERAAASFAQIQAVPVPYEMARTNGLFLAVIRSDLFRILLPQSVPEAVSSLLALLAAGCLPAYMLAVGGARRSNAAQSVLVVCGAACVLWALGCRFNSITMGVDHTAFFASLALMALLAAGAVADGIRRLNRDANLV